MEDITGRQFGAYQVVEPLGEGGMAAVYKAYHPSTERFVAVKVLPRQLAKDPDFVARFQREAKLLAQLQHPHILPVFDFGSSDGYTYLVMPLVKGGTLADRNTREPSPLPRIRRIITQVGEALQHAHGRGLVHRDLKPSNVLVDDSDNCLLADFGLARIVEGSEEATKLTKTGAIMGTPAYMSPEQGSGVPVDARTDIYSLGVMLYELATGRVPYRAETPIAVIIKHMQDPLPMPRSHNSTLPVSVELVILKAMAKNREDRYQSAADFARAIQAAIPEVAAPADLDPTESPPAPRTQAMIATEVCEPPAVKPGKLVAAPEPAAAPSGDAERSRKRAPRVATAPAETPAAQGSPGERSARTSGRGGPGESEPDGGRRKNLTWSVVLGTLIGAGVLAYVLIGKGGARPGAKPAERAVPPAEAVKPEPTAAKPEPTAAKPEERPATYTEKAVLSRENAVTLSLPGDVSLQMVRIPAGTFTMGAPKTERGSDSDEHPPHRVTLSEYWLGKHEVTQAQWQAVMGTNPSKFSSCGPSCPVEQVSWDDIAGSGGFLERLNGHLTNTGQQGSGKVRLPTEAEWEYGARAGTQTRFSFGDNLSCGDENEACELAERYMWWSANSGGTTHPVGQKQPNGFGLFDMQGNVQEWVADWKGAYPSAPQTNPKGPASELRRASSSRGWGRVCRNGFWGDVALYCRSAYRRGYDPGDRSFVVGFRLARSQ